MTSNDGAGSAEEPLVDVVIAVHTAARPIHRIVGSILDATSAPVRVTVVAHNISAEVIGANLTRYSEDPRLRILELHDGIASPAGPLNLGLDRSTARFLSIAGSDDEFAPGAIDSWLTVQAETAADVVLSRITLVNGKTDPYPPVRNGRRLRDLDPVRDRLSYRSAPLGLIDRRRHAELRFTEGLPSGEDLSYSGALWFTSAAIAYDLTGPAYVGHGDAVDRVTSDPRGVDVDFGFLDAVEGADWFRSLDARARSAVVVKYLRVHVFDAIRARLIDQPTFDGHRSDLIAVVARLRRLSPGAFGLLARADNAVLQEVMRAGSDVDGLRTLVARRGDYRRLDAMITVDPLRILSAQAPFRTLLAGLRVMSQRGLR